MEEFEASAAPRTPSQMKRNTQAKIVLKGGPSCVANDRLKEDMRRREACESLRFLVFGGDCADKPGAPGMLKKQSTVFEQRCGTREEIQQLQHLWEQIDEDGSGDVEFKEFLSFFSRSKADRLLGMRCVKYLVDGDTGEGKSMNQSCRIEDMMR